MITEKHWGLSTHINLYSCNKEIITSKEKIHSYVVQLCDLIEVNRYGEPHIIHFGDRKEIAGYTLIQLIETSSITGHFVDINGDAYIDVFSCKFYDVEQVINFTKDFFNAKRFICKEIKR